MDGSTSFFIKKIHEKILGSGVEA